MNMQDDGGCTSGYVGNLYRTWVETYTGSDDPIIGLERKPDSHYLQDQLEEYIPSPNKTVYSIGQSITGTFINGASVRVFLAWDSEGNWGVFLYYGATEGNPSASCTTDFSIYDCENLDNLIGMSYGGGGSGFCQYGFGGGAEESFFQDDYDKKWYSGMTFSTGIGIPGGEGHGSSGYTFPLYVH